MQYTASADEMARLDELAVEAGLEIRQMMELAGWQMVGVFQLQGIDVSAPVAIAVGKGNKGGDGLAAARHLSNYGFKVNIVLSSRDISKDAQHHLGLAEKMGIKIVDWGSEGEQAIREAAVIIDALIGYRLSGDPYGDIADMVNFINMQQDRKVISYDLPTGMDATTGDLLNPCIDADATLTLALPKKAQETASVHQYGQIYLADIGIPAFIYDQIAEGSRPDFGNGIKTI